jgi:hypothetical protein
MPFSMVLCRLYCGFMAIHMLVSSTIVAPRLIITRHYTTAARLFACFSGIGLVELARLLVAEGVPLLLARKAYMYSIPTATLSSGVNSRLRMGELVDEAVVRELRREVWVEEEVHGSGLVESLKGLLKMTAWLDICGRGEAVLSPEM